MPFAWTAIHLMNVFSDVSSLDGRDLDREAGKSDSWG